MDGILVHPPLDLLSPVVRLLASLEHLSVLIFLGTLLGAVEAFYSIQFASLVIISDLQFVSASIISDLRFVFALLVFAH